MSKRSQYQNNKRQKPHARPPMVRPPLEIREAKAAKVYGKPFILLEDANRATFQFLRGAWVPYPKNIAECRQDCEVKQLSQKVNNMTGYEIRCPVAAD